MKNQVEFAISRSFPQQNAHCCPEQNLESALSLVLTEFQFKLSKAFSILENECSWQIELYDNSPVMIIRLSEESGNTCFLQLKNLNNRYVFQCWGPNYHNRAPEAASTILKTLRANGIKAELEKVESQPHSFKSGDNPEPTTLEPLDPYFRIWISIFN